MIVHAACLRPLLRERYGAADVDALAGVLAAWGVPDLPALPNGLYAAVARPVAGAEETGYGHTWVRDTVHVAHVAWERGDVASAARTAASLRGWFLRQEPRFLACIRGEADLADPMQRPHVRFIGATLEESPQWWPHAQNDALGYGLWFLARAALAGLLPLDDATADMLLRFPRYFAAVRFASDRDSGHWEEGRKVNASSLGTVLAGLIALRGLLRARPGLAAREGAALVEPLLEQGRAALAALLPDESRGNADPHLDRGADAALLFLLHPLRVVVGDMADTIVERVERELLGPHGIRRYPRRQLLVRGLQAPLRRVGCARPASGPTSPTATRGCCRAPRRNGPCSTRCSRAGTAGASWRRAIRAIASARPGTGIARSGRSPAPTPRSARGCAGGLVAAGLATAGALGAQRRHAAALDAGRAGLRRSAPCARSRPSRRIREDAARDLQGRMKTA